MYEVMQSDSAHNGEALFHADKYIYIYIREIYILKGIFGIIYIKNLTYTRAYTCNWRLCRKAITYMDVCIIPYLEFPLIVEVRERCGKPLRPVIMQRPLIMQTLISFQVLL